MEAGEIRSKIEGIARELERAGCRTDANNIRRASAKFYLEDDMTMLRSTLATAKLIYNKLETIRIEPC